MRICLDLISAWSHGDTVDTVAVYASAAAVCIAVGAVGIAAFFAVYTSDSVAVVEFSLGPVPFPALPPAHCHDSDENELQ